MYKKSIFSILAASLFLIIFSSLTFAYTISVADKPNYGSTNGGVFIATTTGGVLGNKVFDTFCLEASEHISYGTGYFYTISDSAMYGGIGVVDPLSIATAYIYYHYITGDLASLSGLLSLNTDAFANVVQNAIWKSEGETYSNYSDVTTLYNYAVTQVGNGNANGYMGVHVLNLWSSDTMHTLSTARQDQLVYTPTPIPGALLLLGSGLIGLVGIRRRILR